MVPRAEARPAGWWAAASPRRGGPCRRPGALGADRRRQVVAPAVAEPPQEAWAGKDLEVLSLPEGNFGWPVVGETIQFLNNQIAFALKRVAEHGNVFKSHVWGSKSVFVCGTEAIRKVIQLEANGAIGVDMVTPSLKVFGPCSMLVLNGREHGRMKNLLGPVFSRDTVASFVPYIVDTAKAACAKCECQDYFPMAEEMKRYAFDVMVTSFLGMEFPSRTTDEVVDLLYTVAEGLFDFGIDLPFTKFRRAMRARNELIHVMGESIRALEACRHEGEVDAKALSLILDARDEDGNGLETSVIIDTIILILYAGYDTFGSKADTILQGLSHNPQIWDKLREEQRLVMESFGEEITPEALAAMPYAEAVVKEGLRIQPTVQFVMKRARRSFELEGYRIPKDWQIAVGHTFNMRHLDDTWSDPNVFRPERFLEEGAQDMKMFAPFGMGPHTCLGKELALVEARIMLAVLARDYEVTLEDPDAPIVMFPIPHASDGCMAKVRKLSGRAL